MGYFLLLVFLDKGFRFQPDVSNGCQDVIITSMNLSNIVILIIHGVDYCCIISGISKNEAINLLKNSDLTEKGRTLSNIRIYYHI